MSLTSILGEVASAPIPASGAGRSLNLAGSSDVFVDLEFLVCVNAMNLS